MAVVSVAEQWQEQRTSRTPDSIEHTLVFFVHVSEVTDGTAVAESAAALPSVGDEHPRRDGSVLLNREARPLGDDPHFFRVQCHYSSSAGVRRWQSPLLRPWVRVFTFNVQDGEAVTGPGGHAYLNSARDVMIIQRDIAHPTLTITRNEKTFSPSTAEVYVNTVNDRRFWGVDEGRAKLSGIDAAERIEGNFPYAEVTYTIEFRKGDVWRPEGGQREWVGWDDVVVDQGPHIRRRDKQERPRDSHGAILDSVLLDGEGRRLGEGLPPVLIRFKRYQRWDWRALDLERGGTTFGVPSRTPGE